MRFKGLDLNLLVALDVLIQERNVSRAAERLHLSQPAMSAALRRLREYFNDPILAVHAKRMIPTPHAMRLHAILEKLRDGVEQMINVSTKFEPEVSQRRFSIGASDYITTVLMMHLLPRLQQIAPNVTLDIVPVSDTILSTLNHGDLDLIITVAEHVLPDHPTEFLMDERHVVAGWKENPVFTKPLTTEVFLAAGHVAVEIGRLRPTSFAERVLKEQGHERNIEVLVSSFSSVPHMLINTTRIAVMHERLAQVYARQLPLVFMDLPFDFPVMQEMLQYHKTRSTDSGLMWLKSEIHAAAAQSIQSIASRDVV